MSDEFIEQDMRTALASFHALPFVCDVYDESGEWLFEGRTTGEVTNGKIEVYATPDKLSQRILQEPDLFHDGDYLLWARGSAEFVRLRTLENGHNCPEV